ncbi:ATP-binding protein [Pedobacter sp.]|uniref:hybrid sensor histidine kinase/response regulator n=1 Tax=Pedobacter sp. TaxID=1411316 RepID=UPI00396CF98E
MANPNRFFFRATKGKVILGFLFGLVALFLAWGVSRFVFREILGTVEKVSSPNVKLKMVNSLSHKIYRLDQLQTDHKPHSSNFVTETKAIRKALDTLSILYKDDSQQLKRINSLKRLLTDRNKQFLSYLEVKETLVNTKSFSDEVQKLSEMFAQQSKQIDSATYTTEKSTSTTTVAPAQPEEKSKGFLSRLFGKKKAEVYEIIKEELTIKKDTLNPKIQDSLVQNIETTLRNIELEQKEKSTLFVKKETELASSSHALTKQMLNVLKEVEAEALAQVDQKGLDARNTVNQGIHEIKLIMISFLCITLILGYLIFADIAKSNKYRIALEQAKDEAEYHGKAKQRFLSNMSHEIRTPLQSILGYSEYILRQNTPNPKHVAAIHQSSVHLLQIVNEILDYNRIISGEFSFVKETFEMNSAIKEVIEAMQPLAQQKNLLLDYEIETDKTFWLKGDVFRLKQILYNLIGNAIKFTIKGKVILSLESKWQEEMLHCYFRIEDTGIGFSKEDAERIFNEFEQLEIPQKRVLNQHGSGLGLNIVKTLIDAQGGRISVKSEPGNGTVISFYLKFEKGETAQKKSGLHYISNQHFNPSTTVWVIDDDQLILDLCGLVFSLNNINYELFNNAIDILNADIPDHLSHVLIDIRLRETSGTDLIKRLKKKLPVNIAYYAITAQVLPDEQQNILKKGFKDILIKPFKTEDLLSLLKIAPQEKQTEELDMGNLLKMAMGDQKIVASILKTFIKDCEEDSELLKSSLKKHELEESRLIVHRLAGRISQVGAGELGQAFRSFEMEIEQKGQIDTGECHKATQLLERLKLLVRKICDQQYIKIEA